MPWSWCWTSPTTDRNLKELLIPSKFLIYGPIPGIWTVICPVSVTLRCGAWRKHLNVIHKHWVPHGETECISGNHMVWGIKTAKGLGSYICSIFERLRDSSRNIQNGKTDKQDQGCWRKDPCTGLEIYILPCSPTLLYSNGVQQELPPGIGVESLGDVDTAWWPTLENFHRKIQSIECLHAWVRFGNLKITFLDHSKN